MLVDRDDAVVASAHALTDAGLVAHGVVADLTQDITHSAWCATPSRERHGRVVLIGNAGITRDARLATMEPADFTAVIDVNLLAAMRLTFALRAQLRDSSGSVISMSSTGGARQLQSDQPVRVEVGTDRIHPCARAGFGRRMRVNAVAPGLIRFTAMSRAMPPDVLGGLRREDPGRPHRRPADITRSVAFLVSDPRRLPSPGGCSRSAEVPASRPDARAVGP